MPAKMPQPLRAVFSVMKFATEHGLAPGPAKRLRQPHDERLKRVTPAFMVRPGPAVDTEDVAVSGRDGPIPVRVYTRPGTRPGAPAILFIHGGGFVDLDLDFCDNVQRGLAQRTGYVVVGLSYRLAPEHPFPAGYDDCLAATLWAASHQQLLGGDGRVAVGGDSAGGNLAAALCLELRDRGAGLAAQLLLYPALALGPASDRAGPVDLGYVVSSYLGGRAELASDPRVSPLRAPDLSGLPPAVIGVAEFDELRHQGRRYADALQAAGVEVVFHEGPGMIHGFFGMGGVSPAADRISAELCQQLKTMLAGQSGSAAPALRPDQEAHA
jgi:acetyl esterase